MPSPGLTILTSELGRPYPVDHYGNRLRALTRAAGWPQRTLDGLQKAVAVRLAELGAMATTPKEWDDSGSPPEGTSRSK